MPTIDLTRGPRRGGAPRRRMLLLTCGPALAAVAVLALAVRSGDASGGVAASGPTAEAVTRDLTTTVTDEGTLQRSGETIVSHAGALSPDASAGSGGDGGAAEPEGAGTDGSGGDGGTADPGGTPGDDSRPAVTPASYAYAGDDPSGEGEGEGDGDGADGGAVPASSSPGSTTSPGSSTSSTSSSTTSTTSTTTDPCAAAGTPSSSTTSTSTGSTTSTTDCPPASSTTTSTTAPPTTSTTDPPTSGGPAGPGRGADTGQPDEGDGGANGAPDGTRGAGPTGGDGGGTLTPGGRADAPTGGSVLPGNGADDGGGAAPEFAVLTGLVDVGTTAARGTVLYTADDQPVVGLIGGLPAWRTLEVGVDDGADVRQLEENLVALGYGAGLDVDETYTADTAAAVEAWETDLGRTDPDGVVTIGDVVFLAAPGDVLGHEASVGDTLAPGSPVLAVGSEQRVVVAAVDADAAGGWAAGSPVEIEWADGTTARGSVFGTGREVTDGQVELVVALGAAASGDRRTGAQAAVTLVDAHRAGVVAVPVAALVDDGGASAVRVPRGDGPDDVVPVDTGLVAEGWVEITDGLDAGERVRLPG